MSARPPSPRRAVEDGSGTAVAFTLTTASKLASALRFPVLSGPPAPFVPTDRRVDAVAPPSPVTLAKRNSYCVESESPSTPVTPVKSNAATGPFAIPAAVQSNELVDEPRKEAPL